MFSKMKYYLMVFVLPVFAPSFVAADNIDQEDLTFIFGDMAAEQTLEAGQLELLSRQEMIDTEGDWFWFAAVAGYRMGRAISIYQRYHYGVWVPMAYRRFQTI